MKNNRFHLFLKIVRMIILTVLGCVEFFLAFIAAYLTISLILMAISTGVDMTGKEEITIYMKSDGVHTDFVFPVKNKYIDWRTVFSPENTKGNDHELPYIAVGWGDQGFFLNTPEWSDLTFKTAFNAAFYLGKTAVHVNYLKKLDFKYKHVKLTITKKQYIALCNYIKKTLRTDKQNHFVCIKGRGYWETDAFYEANGSYGLFATCNSWINSGLKEADLPACFWAPFNSGIFHKYR